MRSLLKDNKGLTLIEILAAVVILTIISSVITSVFISSSKTHSNQVKANQQLVDVTYISKALTKDVRMSTMYEGASTDFKLTSGVTNEQQHYKFNSTSGEVFRNDVLLTKEVVTFSVKQEIDISGFPFFKIHIESINGTKIETIIFSRWVES